MTSLMGEADDRFSGIDIDSLLNGQRRPLSFERKKALYEAPEFIQRLNGEETVEEGQSLCIECKIRGFPVPRLRWFKDDEEIINHPRIHVDSDGIGGYYLFIEHVTREDEAAYRCRAENVEGACSSFFFLSVTGQPKRDLVPSWRTVSYPTMFSTIMEKVEEEEKQGKECDELPPSPLTEFYYALTLKSRCSWPAFLGDWAFVNNRHPFRRHSSFSDSDDIAETEEDDEDDDANSDTVFIPNDDICEKLKYHHSNKAHFAAKRGSRTNAKSKTKKQKLGKRADQDAEKGHTINESDRGFENKNERNKSKTENDLELNEIQKVTLLENSELESRLQDPHVTKEEMRRLTKEEIAMPSLTFYKDTKDSDIIPLNENNNHKERDMQTQGKADREKKTRDCEECDRHTSVTKNKEQENVYENTKQTSTTLYNGTEADHKIKENKINTQLISNYVKDDSESNRQKIPENVNGISVEKTLSNKAGNEIHNSSNQIGLNTNLSNGTAPEPKPLRVFRLDMPESGSLVNEKETRLSPNVESSFRYHVEADRYDTSPVRYDFESGRKEKSPFEYNVESERKEKSPFRYKVESERNERSPGKCNIETQQSEKSPVRYNLESERNGRSPLRYNVESDRNERSPFRYTVESDRTERSPSRYNVDYDRNEKSPLRYTAESDKTERSPFRYTVESDRTERSPYRYTAEYDRTERSPYRYTAESDRTERSPYRYTAESDRIERSPYRYTAESDKTERSPFRYNVESERNERSPLRYTVESDRNLKSPFRYTVESETKEKSPFRYNVEYDRIEKSPFRYGESDRIEKSPSRYVESVRIEKSPSRYNVESERNEKSPFRYGQQNSEAGDSGTYQLHQTKYRDTRRPQQTQVNGKDRLEELRQQEIRRMEELKQEEQKRLEQLKHEGETNTYKYKRTQIQYGDVRERERKQIDELRRKEQLMREELHQKEQQQLEDYRRKGGSLIDDMKLKERGFSDTLTSYEQETEELRHKEQHQMEELKERESLQKEKFIAKESMQIEDMKAYERKFIDEMKFKDRTYYDQAEYELQKEEAEQEERKKMKEEERSLQIKKEQLMKEQLRRQFEEEMQKRLKDEEEAKRHRILRLDIAKESKLMSTLHQRSVLLRGKNILPLGNSLSNNKPLSNTETIQRSAFRMKSMEDTDLSTTLVQNSTTCAINSFTNSLDRRSRRRSDNISKIKNDDLFTQRSSVSEKYSLFTDINNKENDARYTNRTFGDRKPESTSTSVNRDMSSALYDKYSKPSNQSKTEKPLSFASFFAIEESRVAKPSLRTHEDLFKLAESIAAKRERFNEYISHDSSEDTTSSLPTQKEKMASFQDQHAKNTQATYSCKEKYDSSNDLGKTTNARYLNGTEHSVDKNNPEPKEQTKSLSRTLGNNPKESTAAGSSEIRPFIYNSTRTTARRFHKTE